MSSIKRLKLSIENTDNPNNFDNTDATLKIFRGLGKVLNEVGILGFIVIVIAIIVIWFPTQIQKSEIIDNWVLFKGSNIPFVLTVIVLVGTLISQRIHYIRVIKLKDERIKNLAENKNSNYKNKLRAKLSSSNKPQK